MTKSLASSQTASKGWDPKITLSVTRLARHHHLELPVAKQVAVPGKSGSCLECRGRVDHRGFSSFSAHMDCRSVHTRRCAPARIDSILMLVSYEAEDSVAKPNQLTPGHTQMQSTSESASSPGRHPLEPCSTSCDVAGCPLQLCPHYSQDTNV